MCCLRKCVFDLWLYIHYISAYSTKMTVAILILIVNIMLSYHCYEKKSSVHSSKFLARVDLNLYFDLKNIYEAFKTVSEWGKLAFKMNKHKSRYECKLVPRRILLFQSRTHIQTHRFDKTLSTSGLDGKTFSR